MRYPLNTTPLNGHNTLFGHGNAMQSLAASGRGFLMLRAGGHAALTAVASGAGLVAVLGDALASMSIAAQGRGFLIIRGITDGSHAVLTALGDGIVIPWLGGFARMRITAQGIGRVAVIAASTALLRLRAVDRSRNPVAARGNGLADMHLAGSAGIPHPKMTPAQFYSAHASRIDFVDRRASITAAANPSSERAFVVPAEARTVHVSPQRDI